MSSSDDEFGPEISFRGMRSLPFFNQTAAPQNNGEISKVMEENAQLKRLVQQMNQEISSLKTQHQAHVKETADMIKDYKHDKASQLKALRSFIDNCTELDPNGTMENGEFKTAVMWYAMSWGVVLPETLVTRRMGELQFKLDPSSGGYYYRGRKLVTNLLPFAGPYQAQSPRVGSPMSSPGSPAASPIGSTVMLPAKR